MRVLALALVLSSVAALPVRAQAIAFARPSYDLVAVSTEIFFPTAIPGTANEGICLVLNTSGAPLRVRMEVDVVYADGRAERLSRLGDPGVLEPGGGFELSIFFLIPPDVPVGSAQFSCGVRAQSLDRRREQEGEISMASFEIVAP